MSSEWVSTTLGELTSWMSGGTPKKDVAAYWGGDIPWVSANSMHGTRYADSDLRITYQGLVNGSRLAPKGSVLLLVRGGALHNRVPVGIATRDLAFNQDVKALVAKSGKLNPWFLLYWLMGHEVFLLESVVEFTGIGAGKLETKRMQALPFMLPPQNEQVAIVSLVRALDDRIALLRETNATLEAIAQAIFKSWFVDFDPVHAKAEGRMPEGMDEETAALLPDGFEESGLGLIPRGWVIRSMADVSTVGIGKTPPRKEPQWFSANQSDVRWVSIRDMGAIGVYAAQTNEFLTNDAVEKFNVRRVPDNTVLMSFKMTIGRIAITDGEMTTNEAIAHFRLADDASLTTEYIYLHLKQFDFNSLSSTSSIADAVNSRAVREIPILVPSLGVMSAFQKTISLVFAKIKKAEQQAQTLTDLRDTLLPRLISGKLRLSECQNGIEETTA
ncbi:MAG: hypothetical protein B7Y07_06270 [Halothiobacillus sp. 24-54-40]|nr:MAG: hypothetical protein B7Y58_07500 [Halothiobacillus sp. 35-54-62]OYZ86920.1 MAG: hypothetical protein B7Y07_06270 [Halothiobacillus sp. 24-54-40]OZA80297.1 MAG: hypothetical protein B7X64_06470 [Halothiobacillus sp. 39-53-45]HQS02318.1 restriction endonuclease subunit S [Halothiobacillus sp.]HQT40057.1 restriction endonuclease subunit S [Acidocella sp.]